MVYFDGAIIAFRNILNLDGANGQSFGLNGASSDFKNSFIFFFSPFPFSVITHPVHRMHGER